MQTATVELVRDPQFDDTVDGFSGDEGANDNEGKWGPEFRNDGDPRIISPEPTEGDDGPEGKKELVVTAENFLSEDADAAALNELAQRTGTRPEDWIAQPVYNGISEEKLSQDGKDFLDANDKSVMDIIRASHGNSDPHKVEMAEAHYQDLLENPNKFIPADQGYNVRQANGTEKYFATISLFDKATGTRSSKTFERKPDTETELVPTEEDENGSAENFATSNQDVEVNSDSIENIDQFETVVTANSVMMAETAQVQEEETQVALERFFAETVIPAPTPSTADSIGDRLFRAALFFEPQVIQQETQLEIQQEVANENILSPIQPQDLAEIKVENDAVVAAEIQSQPAFNSEKIVHSETQAELVTEIEPEIVSDGAKMEEEKEEASEPEATFSILNAIPTIKVISRELTEARQASERIVDPRDADDEGAVDRPEFFTAVDFATEQESIQTVTSEAIQESTLAKAPVESGIRLVKVDAVPAQITREIPKVAVSKQVEVISPRKPDDIKREIDEEIKPEVPRETNTAEVVEASKAENSADEKFSNEIIVDTTIGNNSQVESENRARGIEATQKEIDIARDEIIFTPQGGQTDRLQSDLQMIGARMSASAANDNQQISTDRARSNNPENTFPTQSRSGITMRIAA